ncbi:MAG: hypothetical protein ABI462_14855 [Ignavibacteria bacterium]
MSDSSRKWLVQIESWRGWKVSASFIKELNKQLQEKFETATGIEFEGNKFHFMLENDDSDLQYFENERPPYGQFIGTLMYSKGQIDSTIVWNDKDEKSIIRIEDEIAGRNVQFEWSKLPAKDPSKTEKRKSTKTDLRSNYSFNVSFPVTCYYPQIGTDISFIITIKDEVEVSKIEEVLLMAQNEWNKHALTQQPGDELRKGVIHSVRFNQMDEDGRAVFYVDIGSAAESGYKVLIESLGNQDLGILEIEIENG